MAIGDIYQIQIYYNIGSERTMNVVHMRETQVCTDPLPAESVAQAVRSVWAVRINTIVFSDELSIPLIHARRIKPTAGVPSTIILGTVANPAINGGGSAPPVPSTSCGLISLYTNLNTRNGRGRLYIPGIDRVQQNDGQLIAGALVDWETFADDLEDEIVAVGPDTGAWRFAVYSRELGTAENVVQTIAHTNLATQRSRRNFPGIGI